MKIKPVMLQFITGDSMITFLLCGSTAGICLILCFSLSFIIFVICVYITITDLLLQVWDKFPVILKFIV